MTPRPFHIQLPSPYQPSASEILLTDVGAGWRWIRSEFRNGNAIRIPSVLVAPSARVSDEGRYRIEQDCSLTYAPAAIEREGVAVVLESPHTAEFGPGLTAIRPLNRRSTQRLLAKRLPDLLTRAEHLSGVEVGGRQLVLINAVQYQCSLHAFMSPGAGNLQGDVRDATWSALFDAGGAQDLLKRINDYAPALVLLAPTKGIREKFVNFIGEAPRAWPWMRINRHPAGWATTPAFGPLAPDGELVASSLSSGARAEPFRYPTPIEERSWRTAGVSAPR